MGQNLYHGMLMPLHDSMPSFMNFRRVLDLLEFKNQASQCFAGNQQCPVPAWYDMFQDHTYAEACLARMLSGAYRLEMNGKNMRDMEPINK